MVQRNSRAVGEGAATALTASLGLEKLVELLSGDVRRVLLLDGATLGHDIGSSVGALGAAEARELEQSTIMVMTGAES